MVGSTRAQAELARIASHAPGVVGVAARHIETGHTLDLNGTQRFPMASTVKVPIALAVLALADRGALALTDLIAVEPHEMNPSGPLGEEFLQPGVALSVINLLEPMITRSDNTATDVLLRLAGGPAGVARYLASLGVDGITPSRTIRDLLAVLYGVEPKPGASMRDAINALPAADAAAVRERGSAPNPAYHDDPRDQATPAGMTELLRRMWQCDGVSPAARGALLDIMGRTSTGLRRIAGRLPKGAKVANKTGSAAGTTNDCGFMLLPGELGAVALTIYVKASPLPAPEREDLIADLARTVYDWAVL